jgi:flagella basal body P-ring formation protein FlgA
VVIQKVVELKGTVVRLGDVAKVKADDKQESERLASLTLMPAPGPGRRRFLRMREVQDLVAAHGEDMGSLNFRGERIIEVATAAEVKPALPPATDRRAILTGTSVAPPANMAAIAPDAPQSEGPRLTEAKSIEAYNYIKRAVVEHLVRQSGRNSDWQVVFEVSPVDLAKVLDAKTALQCSGGVLPWTGNQRLVVAFATSRGPVRIRFEAIVTVEHTVIVAAQPIERGHVITAADVAVAKWTTLPKETPRHQLAVSLESLIGMEATGAVQAGDALYSDDYRAQLLVRKGDEIAVYARGGGIQVRTIARARQDGARGELIGVESLDAKEPFDAVVTAAREAVVFTGTTIAKEEKVVEQPFRKLRQE